MTDRREKLRRACEDGERLYRIRMEHDEPTIADDNRIDGILTLDLTDALGFVDALLAERDAARQQANAFRIEADCAMRDYDALELDAGVMRDALEKIARTVGIVTRTSDGVALRTAPEYTAQGAHDLAVAALAVPDTEKGAEQVARSAKNADTRGGES